MSLLWRRGRGLPDSFKPLPGYYYPMPVIVDERPLLYAVPRARSLRELARIAGVAATTAIKFYQHRSRRGKFFIVPDDAYYGLARVVFIAEKAKWPGSLPYGSLSLHVLSSPSREHALVIGLVPQALARNYVDDLHATLGEGRAFIAQEVQHWLPLKELQGLRPEKVAKLPGIVDSILPKFERPEPLKMPDFYDLVYLTGKMMLGPYPRPKTILEKLQHLHWAEIPSHTVISYHYRVHFLPGWLYTTYHEYRDPGKAPVVALELEGKDAPRVAKALALLPAWGSSYIAGRWALYVGQVEASFLPYVYELLHEWRAEATRGLMFVKASVELDTPLLWKFLSGDEKTWVWVEERARVPSHA